MYILSRIVMGFLWLGSVLVCLRLQGTRVNGVASPSMHLRDFHTLRDLLNVLLGPVSAHSHVCDSEPVTCHLSAPHTPHLRVLQYLSQC